MNRLFAALIFFIAGIMPATAVTIDFEEFSLGTSSVVPFVSMGYEFQGLSYPGPIPDGMPSEIVTGISGTIFPRLYGWGEFSDISLDLLLAIDHLSLGTRRLISF